MKQAFARNAKEEVRECRTGYSGRAVAYASVSALFSLFALLGLFLCPVPSPAGEILAGRKSILGGSLFGVIVEIARGSMTIAEDAPGPAPLLYALLILLAAATAASLALTALAFFFPGKARPLALSNGTLILFLHLAVALLCYLAGETDSAPILTGKIVDVSALLCALLCAVALTAVTMAERKGWGAGNFFLLLLAAVCLFACFYPDRSLRSEFTALFSGEYEGEPGVAVCLYLLAAALVLNLFVCVLRMCACGRYAVDLLRFGLQTLLSLVLIAVSAVSDGNWDMVTEHLLSVPLLLCASLSAFLLSALLSVRAEARKRKSALPIEEREIRDLPPSRALLIARNATEKPPEEQTPAQEEYEPSAENDTSGNDERENEGAEQNGQAVNE